MNKIDKSKIKTWFITGASSGIGYKLTQELLEKGYNVTAVARRVPNFNHPNVLCLSCDVTDRQSVQNAINEGIKKFGKIDVLLNNAGITAGILCEDESLEHMKQVMEVNFFGSFNTINLLLPHFRKNKNGTIINNTSMHGISYRKSGSAYVSSKHALEGLTSVVRHETNNFCRVMAFELGFFAGTDIVKNTTLIKNNYSEYQNIPPYEKNIDYKSFQNITKKAITLIINTVEQDYLPRYLILGFDSIFKAKCEAVTMQNDIEYSEKYLSSCIKILSSVDHYFSLYFKYLKYKLLKNLVWGKVRKRYKRKAKELHSKIRQARKYMKVA